MAIKCSQVTLPILFSVMIVVMALNYLGFCYFCSFYQLFPSFVMTPQFLTVGYSVWAGLIESLPIGMVATAYIHGEHERDNAAMTRAGMSVAAGRMDPGRSLPVAISVLGAMFVAELVSSYLTSEIDQARIFSKDVLLLANFVRALYAQIPLSNLMWFAFLAIGYREHDRVFVSE